MTAIQENEIKRQIFVAFRFYDEDFEPVIIIAETEDEAREKGKAYFGLSSFALKRLVDTRCPSVYEF
ncbi:MAG: hypothetical protein NC489_42470 [Ruminococcus flavefaciens]|nr:hypothetical protein [Ruminococcus flavefaciens]